MPEPMHITYELSNLKMHFMWTLNHGNFSNCIHCEDVYALLYMQLDAVTISLH